jgi:hypothetical protein
MEHVSTVPTQRQRASHIGHVHNRAARLVVRDIQQHLGNWQHIAATLRALKLHGRDDADVRVRAEELLPMVMADRIELDARLESLEIAVAHHSLPRDVRRALDRLQGDLEKLVQTPGR